MKSIVYTLLWYVAFFIALITVALIVGSCMVGC